MEQKVAQLFTMFQNKRVSTSSGQKQGETHQGAVSQLLSLTHTDCDWAFILQGAHVVHVP